MSSNIDGAARVALVLPGRGYTVKQPALYYVAAVASELGWTIEVVDWQLDAATTEQMVAPGLVALQRLPREGSIVIGKSLGSALLPVVVDLGLPGVWLTPILRSVPMPLEVEAIRAAAANRQVRSLLVGATADTTWDSGLARTSGQEVLELDVLSRDVGYAADWGFASECGVWPVMVVDVHPVGQGVAAG